MGELLGPNLVPVKVPCCQCKTHIVRAWFHPDDVESGKLRAGVRTDKKCANCQRVEQNSVEFDGPIMTGKSFGPSTKVLDRRHREATMTGVKIFRPGDRGFDSRAREIMRNAGREKR